TLACRELRKYFLQQPRCRDYIHEIIHKINMIGKVFSRSRHSAGSADVLARWITPIKKAT
ncbi:hypothetical protein, partial [Klebsiella variicola]